MMAETIEREAAALPEVAAPSYDDTVLKVCEHARREGVPADMAGARAMAEAITGKKIASLPRMPGMRYVRGSHCMDNHSVPQFGDEIYPNNRMVCVWDMSMGLPFGATSTSVILSGLPTGVNLHLQMLWCPYVGDVPPLTLEGESTLIQYVKYNADNEDSRESFLERTRTQMDELVKVGFTTHSILNAFVAVPPEGHWMSARHGAIIFPKDVSVPAYRCIVDAVAMLDKGDGHGEQVLRAVEGLLANVVGVREDIARRESEATNVQDEARRLAQRMTTAHRIMQALRMEMRHMNRMLVPIAIENLRATAGISDDLLAHRGVNSVTVTHVNGGAEIVIETHPFTMRLHNNTAWHGQCCESCEGSQDEDGDCDSDCYCHNHIDALFDIAPARITIDTSMAHAEEGIRVEGAGDRLVHPHIHPHDDTCCWGEALSQMATAWGERDWRGLVMVVLGWYGKYATGRAPYIWAHDLLREYGASSAERPGWVVPDNGVFHSHPNEGTE